MSQVTSRAQINVYINEGSAVASMKKLDSQYAKLVQKQIDLKEGTKKWLDLEDKKKDLVQQYEKLAKSIDITKLSLKDLKSEQQRLNSLFEKTDYGSKGYFKLQSDLQAVNNRIKEVKSGLGPFGQAWAKLRQELLSVQGIFLALFAGGFLTTSLVGFIKTLGDLDDQLADIRKTTGMSAKEVEELNKRFGTIDTRTAKKELRDIAIVLGQMGYTKDEIFGTAVALDKLAVSLSDEFSGGARDVADTMGKLRNVLIDMKTKNAADDMLRLGNALNVLGQEGIATGPVVAEFANRIGGVGVTLGLTSGQVLGLSAAMQEMNISAERGSTAVVGILQKMTTHTKEFARVAGMTTEEFADLVNNDIYGAFMKVTKGAAENANSATLLGELLKDLSVDGARVSEVFTKIGNNTELVTDKVNTATQALTNTDSILDEFAIKNNTLGAQLAKLQKDLYGLFANDEIKNGAVDLVKRIGNFVKALKENADTIVFLLKIVGSMILSWGSYKLMTATTNSAVGNFGKTLWAGIQLIRLQVQQFGAASTAGSLYRTGLYGIQLAANSLKIGLKSLWLAFMENPLGWIVAGFTMLYTLLETNLKKVKSFRDTLKELNDIRKQFNDDVAKEVGDIRALFDALRRVNPESAEFVRLKQELNDKYGVTLDNYSKELGYLDQLEKAENKLIGAQLKKLALKAKDEQVSKIFADLFEWEKKSKELESKVLTASDKNYASGYNNLTHQTTYTNDKNIAQGHLDHANRQITKLKDELSKVVTDTDDFIADIDRKYTNAATYAENLMWDTGVGAPDPSNPSTWPKVAKPSGDDKKKPSGYTPDEDKKRKDSVDFQISEMERLKKALHTMRNDMVKTTLDADEKELFDIRERYDSEIRLANEANELIKKELQRKDLTPEEINKLKANGEALTKMAVEIAILRDRAVANKTQELAIKHDKENKERRAKEYDEAKKDWDKYAKARQEAWDKLEEATLNEHDRNRLRVTKEYNELLDLATEFGYNTVAVEEMRLKAMAKLRRDEINDAINEFEKYYRAVGDIASAAMQFSSNTENADLYKFKASNDRKKEILEKQYNLKLISEEKYRKRVDELDEAYETKRKELAKKQFERQRAADVISSLINTAVAVTKALASAPPPANFALAALVGIAGAAQTGAIAAQPTPEFRIGGEVVDGPSHEQGGIDLYNKKKKKIGNMEGGEAIWSKATVKNNPRVTKYMLNASMFNGGRKTMLEQLLAAYPMLDLQGALLSANNTGVPVFKGGGTTTDLPHFLTKNSSGQGVNLASSDDIMFLAGKIDKLITVMEQKNNEPVESFIVLSKLEKKQQELTSIRKLAAYKYE
jgi:TP901 family phage tail tape measure protein